MQDNHIYDPLKTYQKVLKDKHHENVTKYFDNLVSQSKIDIELNKETIKNLDKHLKHQKNLKGTINKYHTYRVLLILFLVIMVLVTIGLVSSQAFVFNALKIIILIVFNLLAVLGIVLIFTKLNPRLKIFKNNLNQLQITIDSLRKEAAIQMAPLNSLFKENMAIEIFKETLPLINFDLLFDSKRLAYLKERFDLDDTPNINRSTLFVKSGDINGNPFYIANDLVHQLGTKTYTGMRTISWTTYTTINGKRVAQTRTQTLVATLDKPFPYYNEQSYLVYGNEAAPNLIFDRTDSDAENMDQNQIDRHVKKNEKLLLKKARKETKTGGTFTTMAHSEFEVLFGASNRNNEVQFRLLFTPLAQKQLLELMKDKTVGYGDNFDFSKYNKINIVYPEHLKLIDLEINPNYFKSISYLETRDKFINYNNNYFKSIYFSFAPILAIPLYQQHKPHEYIYKDLYKSYVSFYEHERTINKLGEEKFAHPESITRNILKTNIIKSSNNTDDIQVTAYGYKGTNRVTFVPKLGGDGRMHQVAVNWVEYDQVINETVVSINVDIEKKEESYQDKVNNFVKRLQSGNKVNEKDLQKIGLFITYIHKK